MRYAIVSDIHANLPAWKNVLIDIADMKADTIICLGDVVGYGSQPIEVLESVYRTVNVTLMGNHDAAVCGKLDPAIFSPRAQAAVLRHREQLSQDGIGWLSRLPLTFTGPTFRCTHGDFSEPAAFHYIIEPEQAIPSWERVPEQLLFVGHSHLPGIYVIGSSRTPHFIEPRDFQLENGKRYIVNPGSVGYPRNGDCRSSYCLYDESTRTIIFRQLPFDDELYRRSLRNAGLEDDPWLERPVSRRLLPQLQDGPIAFAKQTPRDTRTPAPTQPSRPFRRADRIARPAVLALLVTAAGGFALFQAGRTASQPAQPTAIPAADLTPLVAYPLIPPNKNLLPPLPDAPSADGQLAGWRYAVDDRERQHLETGLRNAAVTLCVRQDDTGRFLLESPPINLAGTDLRAVRLRGRIRKHPAFDGNVSYQLVTYTSDPDGTLRQDRIERYEMRSSKTALSPPGADRDVRIRIASRITHVRLRIEAHFKGLLEIEPPSLTAEPTGAKQ